MTNILYDYEQFLSTKCYADSTKEIYLINIRLFFNFLKEYKGKVNIITLCNITKSDIYNYIAFIDNLKKPTKEIRLYAIHSFYSFLNRDLSNFLFKDIKLFDNGIKLPNYLFSHQIRQVLNFYSNKRDNLIIFLLLTTGIRISELANIEIQNINFQEKYINLKVKGGYYRNVYINNEIKYRLQDYIGDRTEGNLFNLKRRQIHNIVTKPMKEYGIRGSAHTLRHTFATEMYRKTKDILIVKELLGHKSLSSTQIYTYLDNDIVKHAVESNPLANYKVGGRNED